MNRLSKVMLRAGLAALALGTAGSAQAALWQVQYIGSVLLGSDTAGLFGSINYNMAGLQFIAQFTFDDTGQIVPTGSLTINSSTQIINGITYSEHFVSAGPLSQDTVSTTLFDSSGGGYRWLELSAYGGSEFLNNAVGFSPINYTFTSSESTNGRFDFYGPGNRYLANGGLRPTSLEIVQLGAVPEPATWATMLAGFGLMGAAMRKGSGRRKAQQRVLVRYA